MTLLAIDPGNTESGWTIIDVDTMRPIEFGKDRNDTVLEVIANATSEHMVIEMVASYGMAVGASVFETCVWIGRFMQHAHVCAPAVSIELVYRRDVKLHHCQDSRAKDPNIVQALIDRFAPDVSNRGKGTKANPGWFHGFRADIWQAYALAVCAAERPY